MAGLVTRDLKRLKGTRVFNLSVVCKSFHVVGAQKPKADFPNWELAVGTLSKGKLLDRVGVVGASGEPLQKCWDVTRTISENGFI